MNTDRLGRLDKYKITCMWKATRTHVADIDHENQIVKKLGYWSSTTSKHINYVASELGYETEEAK